MAENNVDSAVIKKTQEALGKYVKKPALTEKLLNKPPFRFIHDIINAVIRETGFLDGLFTKTELVSENIKDRDAKIKYLQKLIDAMKLITKSNVSARPSKIVAGHEAEKTNELLQLIGIAIENKLDYKQTVELAQTQSTTVKTKSNPKEKLKSSTSTKEPKGKLVTRKDDGKEKKATKPESIKNISIKNTAIDKQSSKPSLKLKDVKTKEKIIDKNSKKEKKAEILPNNFQSKMPDSTEINKPVEFNRNSIENNFQFEEGKSKGNIQEESTQEIVARKASVFEIPPQPANEGNTVEKEDSLDKNGLQENNLDVIEINKNLNEQNENTPEVTNKSSSKRKKSIVDETLSVASERSKGSGRKMKEEQTAEPRPDDCQRVLKDITSPNATEIKRQSTFIRDDSQNENTRPRTSLRPPSVRPASARPGAPRRRDKNVEIILQPNDQMNLAGINVKLENFESQLEDDGENLVIVESDTAQEPGREKSDMQLDVEGQQGHLVQQILQTQKELIQIETEASTSNDVDAITFNKRQSSARQMDSLRDVIQNLTRSINPLGKLMDFLPEDIDSMHLELNMWRDSYIQAASELKKEKSRTESALEPLKNQLDQIYANIKEHKNMIDRIRAKILQNSDKIHILLVDQ